jgi:hypothetical protein
VRRAGCVVCAVVGVVLALAGSDLAIAQEPTGPANEPGSDVTTVAAADRDALAEFGTREILFVARAASGNVELRAGPDPAYSAVRVAAPEEPMLVVGDRKQYLEVLLPRGFRAFVSHSYVDLAGDGTGTINAAGVNVRAKPSTAGDYPIGQLGEGQKVLVIGTAGPSREWVEIVAPLDVPLWFPDDAVTIGGGLDDAATRDAVLGALENRRQDYVDNSAEARISAAQRALEAELEQRLVAARQRLDDERALGSTSQVAVLRTEFEAIRDQTVDGARRGSAEAALRDVELLERLVATEAEKQRLRDEMEAERKRLAAAALAAKEAAVVERYGAPLPPPGASATISGFLRLRGDDPRHPVALERGSTVAAWLQCTAGRYRMHDFAGLQVEVTGRLVGSGEPPTLEVERITIIRR